MGCRYFFEEMDIRMMDGMYEDASECMKMQANMNDEASNLRRCNEIRFADPPYLLYFLLYDWVEEVCRRFGLVL